MWRWPCNHAVHLSCLQYNLAAAELQCFLCRQEPHDDVRLSLRAGFKIFGYRRLIIRRTFQEQVFLYLGT